MSGRLLSQAPTIIQFLPAAPAPNLHGVDDSVAVATCAGIASSEADHHIGVVPDKFVDVASYTIVVYPVGQCPKSWYVLAPDHFGTVV